uniref:Metalloendopeptidase n=1 Tax=Parastrongyloides trichosuri TaxID=131310 RepID=A0A0N4Z424_PARTI
MIYYSYFLFILLILLYQYSMFSPSTDYIYDEDNEEVTEDNYDDSSSERDKRAILTLQDFDWTFPIQYYINVGVNEANVEEAVAYIVNETCIRFQRVYTLQGATGLNFISTNGCSSFVGRVEITTTQDVAVGPDCSTVGWIMHMIGHALGMFHEETRPDRGKYVRILKNNILQNRLQAFDIVPLTEAETFNLKYDIGALLHSNDTTQTANGRKTIVPYNKNYHRTIGQDQRMSFNEIKLLNLYYCNNICPQAFTCDNRGYLNPNNCSVCKCPRNYSGYRCHLITRSSRGCPRRYIRSTRRTKTIVIRGRKSCYSQIKTRRGYKIRMVLKNSNLPRARVCPPNRGLEVKFFKDKTVTGNTFCGVRRNVIIRSLGYHVSFHYVGLNRNHFIRLQHKRVTGP